MISSVGVVVVRRELSIWATDNAKSFWGIQGRDDYVRTDRAIL